MKKRKDPTLYDLLCDAISCNYTCFRIANQGRLNLQGGNVYSRNDIFGGKTIRDYWLDEKMKGALETRQDVFENLNNAIKLTFADINVDDEMAKMQATLMEQFNKYYKLNKRFDECFDEYEILDPDFKAVFDRFDNYAIISENRLGMNILINTYYTYRTALQDMMNIKAFVAVLKALENDLNSSGYPTMFYGKPRTELSIISKEQLEGIAVTLAPVIEMTDALIAEQNKFLSEIHKKQRKNPLDRTLTQSNLQASMTLKELQIKRSKIKETCGFVSVLKDRLTAATTDYDQSFGTKLAENFYDLTSGINISDEKNNIKVNSTYIHDLEKNYLVFLFKSLGLENPFEKSAKTQEKI